MRARRLIGMLFACSVVVPLHGCDPELADIVAPGPAAPRTPDAEAGSASVDAGVTPLDAGVEPSDAGTGSEDGGLVDQDAADAGTGADEEPAAALGPPYPIVFVHGFSGWSDVGPFEYFYNVRDDLLADGHDVTMPALPPYNSPAERARVLADVVDELLARTGKAKVHLVGHSQGGVDIRQVVSAAGLGYGDRVASVVTIATPHAGSAVADLASSAPAGTLNVAGLFLGWLVGALEGEPPSEADWASDETSDAWTPELDAAIDALRPASMNAYVAAYPMPPQVPFFTVAGVSNLLGLDTPACDGALWPRSDRVDDMDFLFVSSGAYLSLTEGGTIFSPTANDGLLTVTSARAEGATFLGCVPADHLDQIGQVADLTPGLLSGFDHRAFYRQLVGHLRSLE